MSLWHQIAVETPVMMVTFLVVWTFLWRLRSWGYWTVGVGFALFLVLCVAQVAITHGNGSHAVVQGLFLGSMMPTLYMFLYQLGQEKKRN